MSEQIFNEEIDNVLSDMDSEAQDIIIKRHHALLDKNTEINVDKLESEIEEIKIFITLKLESLLQHNSSLEIIKHDFQKSNILGFSKIQFCFSEQA